MNRNEEVVIDLNDRADAQNNDYKSAAVDQVIAEYGGPFIINDKASDAILLIAGFTRELRETTIL